jgi:hypothetical protein
MLTGPSPKFHGTRDILQAKLRELKIATDENVGQQFEPTCHTSSAPTTPGESRATRSRRRCHAVGLIDVAPCFIGCVNNAAAERASFGDHFGTTRS